MPALFPCDSPADIPAGFTLVERGGPFFQSIGPVYINEGVAMQRILGLRIQPMHTNMQGIAHGGMLMTLADGALNTNLSLHYPKSTNLVTVSMNTQFLSSARVGDWLEASVQITRAGRSLSFADCSLQAGQRTVLRANAVFSTRLPASS